MNKTVLFAAAAVLAVSAAGAASAAAPTASIKAFGTRISVPHPGSVVLYSQNSNSGNTGSTSQQFESTYAQYDAQGADDFVVPTGKKWTVKEVDVTGSYSTGGPADSENVFFYKAGKGKGKTLPGAQLGSTINAKGKDNGTGSFAIKLGKGVKLKGGAKGATYWVSVQAVQTFATHGQWYWSNQSTHEGNPAAWQNPGGGFGLGCTTWGVENVCLLNSALGDHMFVLLGKTN